MIAAVRINYMEPTTLLAASLVGCAFWIASFSGLREGYLQLALAVALAAAASWLALLLAIPAVAAGEGESAALLARAARVCALGTAVLAAHAVLNLSIAPLPRAMHLLPLVASNVVMSWAFLAGPAGNSACSKRGRLWALLHLTFVLVLGVIVAAGGAP